MVAPSRIVPGGTFVLRVLKLEYFRFAFAYNDSAHFPRSGDNCLLTRNFGFVDLAFSRLLA